MQWMNRALGAAFLAMAVAACDGGTTKETANENAAAPVDGEATLAAALGGAGDLATASRLIESAGLERALEGQASYTFFAPVDGAFEALPAEQMRSFEGEEGRPQLIALLNQHLVPGHVAAEDLRAGLKGGREAAMATMGTAPIHFVERDGMIRLGTGEDAPRIVGEPLAARNGVIYRIDKLVPPPAQ
jgi:uncharacterized surface protein with fasciclin (FAS1) repeats